MPGGYGLHGYSPVRQNRNSKRSKNVRERGTGEKDVHDAAHALANISPYEDINQRLSWTPMLAITYA